MYYSHANKTVLLCLWTDSSVNWDFNSGLLLWLFLHISYSFNSDKVIPK